MITLFKKLNPLQRRFIRTAYLALIVFLAGFALFTYRQLQAARNTPVALPNYWFYIIEPPGKSPLIQVNGTWTVTEGPQPRDRLQTSTIECQKEKMMCMESTAIVSLREGSYLESYPRVYDIEQWNEKEVVTKPVVGDCSAYTLNLNLVERSATAAVVMLPGKTECKDPARTLKLDNGSKVKAAPAGK